MAGVSAHQGLFKLECEGTRMIALCSKCYYVDQDTDKAKFSITWQRFKAALQGNVDWAEKRGFRLFNGQMVTYEQQKLGLRQAVGIGRRYSHRTD